MLKLEAHACELLHILFLELSIAPPSWCSLYIQSQHFRKQLASVLKSFSTYYEPPSKLRAGISCTRQVQDLQNPKLHLFCKKLTLIYDDIHITFSYYSTFVPNSWPKAMPIHSLTLQLIATYYDSLHVK